jgi:hypothetical protein
MLRATQPTQPFARICSLRRSYHDARLKWSKRSKPNRRWCPNVPSWTTSIPPPLLIRRFILIAQIRDDSCNSSLLRVVLSNLGPSLRFFFGKWHRLVPHVNNSRALLVIKRWKRNLLTLPKLLTGLDIFTWVRHLLPLLTYREIGTWTGWIKAMLDGTEHFNIKE